MFWLRSEGYACQEIWCTGKPVITTVSLMVLNDSKDMLVKMTGIRRPYGLILKASIKIKLHIWIIPNDHY